MKKTILSFTLLVFLLSAHAQTGSITNIRVSQGTGSNERMVDIMFDLSGSSSTYAISLEVSFDNGGSYTAIDPNEITGSLSVGPGTDIHLVWDGRISYPNSSTATARIKIIANSSWSCGDPITDSRDGQTYNTVEIGTQCWMAENLNIGTRIDGEDNQADNGTIEKYCYGDNPSNCDTYGGLYQWNEMMQYITTQGAQGICPPNGGWHLPSDDEWCTLTTYIDPTVDCDAVGYSGTDAGYKMKSTSGWYSNGNGSDAYGFAALPGGSYYTGGFNWIEKLARFWSSTGNGTGAWGRTLSSSYDKVSRGSDPQEGGFSVRCLKD
ncbi:MAG: fibrobacter succinogenes major paralogous domain-containing protein [Bacteroidota bacterium]|nr:fibrobacter succinogenes major paralogous domain-containing protein [Bacteroidota bacterium]